MKENKKPALPYYAVIFTSIRNKGDDEDYAEVSDRMSELAKQQPGYLGHDSARETTASYWKNLGSIHKWKQNAEHKIA